MVALATCYGFAINHCVHPSHSQLGVLSPNQTIVVNTDKVTHAAFISIQNIFHLLAIALPNLGGFHFVILQLLQHVEEPQRCVNRVVCRAHIGEQAILHLACDGIQHIQAALNIAARKGQTRECDEGIAAPATKPRITSYNLGFAIAAGNQLASRVLKNRHKVDFLGTACNLGLEGFVNGFARLHSLERARESDALAFCHFGFEVTGGQQVLVVVITASLLLLVFEVLPPVGSSNKLNACLVGLHIEPGERFVQTAFNTVENLVRVAVSLHIRFAERVFVAESKEGTQTQGSLRVAVNQGVANQQLSTRVYPQELLFQHNATDTIGDGGGRCVLEVHDVLVSFRLVVVAGEFVQCKVKSLVVLDNGFIERRKHNIALIAVVDGTNHQSVIFARVAAHNGSAHITTCTVRSEHLTFERVLQVAQTRFVEFQDRHSCVFICFSFVCFVF